MVKIVEYRELPLGDLVIGQGQVRTQNPAKDVDELARSIESQGLLQPIVVCPARDPAKWEILTGQRRFLAHQRLKKDSIYAAILSERVDEARAKTISITENLIRRKLSGPELKDGILYLYNIYGTIKDVADKTGLPYERVRGYVKYPRLLSELKEMVDDGRVDVNVAVKAQDASGYEEGDANADVAVKLAQEMGRMTGAQQSKIAKERKEHPDKPVDEVIEQAKSGAKVTQIVATITQDTHAALRQFATDEGANQDEAAAMLIEEALVGHGLLEEGS